MKKFDVESSMLGELIDLENSFEFKGFEECINELKKMFNQEEILIMNRIYFYCLRIGGAIVKYEDFYRHVCQIKVNFLIFKTRNKFYIGK